MEKLGLIPALIPLFALMLAGCLGSPETVPSLEDLEIGISPPQPSQLPAIPIGRSTFRPSDPATVNLAADKVQFVEFFAYWCTVCKAMAPSVHGLESLYQDQVNFIYLDRDDDATRVLQDQLGYIYQPHFFLLDAEGIVLGEWRGFVEVEVLQQAIVAALP